MNKKVEKYLIFWFSQSVSQIGSSLTSFALILWAYQQTNSAMSVSFMAFYNYVPYVVVSLFAGAFVDQHSKKKIILFSDFIAASCSLIILVVCNLNALQIRYIYIVNCVIGFMNAFQSPASMVAIYKIVPEKKVAQVSGLNSFTSNLTMVLSPIVSSALYAFGGLQSILVIDLVTFLIAFSILLLTISIPEEEGKKKKVSILEGCNTGFRFLVHNKGIWYVVLTMAVMNFFSRITYENILSPMLLSRSGNNSMVLGIVNAMIGIAGIVGGLIVSSGKVFRDKIKMIYMSAVVSFLLGDVLMGLGKNVVVWCLAGISASVPIPFIIAGQNIILYQNIPKEMQGRVFAVKNVIQFCTIPIGILLGGFLADQVFEPFMLSERKLAVILRPFVGKGKGSGMALMFLCTGVIGSLFSWWVSKRKEVDCLR